MDDGPVLSVNKVADDAKMAIHNLGAFQLLEYQSDVQRCRFDLTAPPVHSRHECTADVRAWFNACGHHNASAYSKRTPKFWAQAKEVENLSQMSQC